MTSTSAPLRDHKAHGSGARAVPTFEPAEVLARLCELPPFQSIAIKVMRISSTDNVNFRELAELLSSDPAFSAGLLRVANSPLFPVRAHVETVLQAATLLGLETLKAMAVTVAGRSYFGDMLTRAHVRRCWTHSVVTAMLARRLAPEWKLPADQAYTASILHDIGRLGLVKAYPSAYEPLLEKRFRDVGENLLEESAVAGMTHCAAAGALMRAWSFPSDLIEAAESHHSDAHCDGMSDLVRACCLCADFLGFSEIGCQRSLTREELALALPSPAGRRTVDGLEELRCLISERLGSIGM
jgi:HD-like signal output (HDOD) protein